jgi:4-hydroxy-tetrahydrodipicolinate synthase
VIEPAHAEGWLDVVAVAATAWFDEEGRLDGAAFEKHCEWLVGEGAGAIVVNGSVGEYEALTADERDLQARAAVVAVAGRVPVIAGVGGRSAAEAHQWADQAARVGCDAVMALPPTSHLPTPDETMAHFAHVAAAGLPVIVYNNPFSTRIDLSAELLARIGEIPGVVAVKEFSQDVRRVAQICRLSPQLTVLCGCDDLLVESALMGARGWIAGFANAFPRLCVLLLELCHEERWAEAVALYRPMLPLLRFDADPRLVQAIKLAQEVAGRPAAGLRLPRLPLSEADAAEIVACAEAVAALEVP